ncbi:MAG: hypothetical protein CMJ81_02195 [Planctomycetaceae bacterium]|nr:hypothetical protein [Planctomycetaceae bacterium]MBP61762.1 hypothetical protein [Planctomycetaceae bacterium]
MQVFVYEFITGGGLLSHSEVPRGHLLGEALAMVTAMANDFARLVDVRITLLCDSRVEMPNVSEAECWKVHQPEEESRLFQKLAGESDWTVVIAPEFGGVLLERCRVVETVGGRLLGPNSELVEMASDKHALCGGLTRAGLKVPYGILLSAQQPLPQDFKYPAVLKPVDGAGSVGIELIDGKDDVPVAVSSGCKLRLEEFHNGMAASVAILGGPQCRLALPACRQFVEPRSGFRYRGGEVPIDADRSRRAQALALGVVDALPGSLTGYLGIDMVLGSDVQDGEDVVIEVNPRLTTSYVGLSRIVNGNLAQLMLDVASSKPGNYSLRAGSVRFDAQGNVTSQRIERGVSSGTTNLGNQVVISRPESPNGFPEKNCRSHQR